MRKNVKVSGIRGDVLKSWYLLTAAIKNFNLYYVSYSINNNLIILYL